MDELGFNKIAGAVLATALGIMVLREAPHFFMHSDMPETPAYRVGPIEVEATGDAEPLPFPQAECGSMQWTRNAVRASSRSANPVTMPIMAAQMAQGQICGMLSERQQGRMLGLNILAHYQDQALPGPMKSSINS